VLHYPHSSAGSAAPTAITRARGRRQWAEQPVDKPLNRSAAATRRPRERLRRRPPARSLRRRPSGHGAAPERSQTGHGSAGFPIFPVGYQV
jgi:hypothetical protein